MDVTPEQTQFIEEQRQWLAGYRAQTEMSWAMLAKRTGVPQGTISLFGANRYTGRELPIAEKVERFRQSLAQQAELATELPEVPGFYETETTGRLERMLAFAQSGEMVAAALEAGCSKTSTAEHYTGTYSNVFHVEVPESAGGPNNLLKMILAALGEVPSGGTYDMSRQIRDQFKKLTQPLLIIDEAQHLSKASIEEVRSWFDKGVVGIAFFGNVGILQQLSKYAQLYSRLSMKLQLRLPFPADVDAMADAWLITNAEIRAELQEICGKLGGLRNGTKTLKLARMIAASQGKELGIEHVRGAWGELDVRMVAA